MILKTLKKLILCAFLLYIPLQTLAWGTLGHRIVGEIADSYLNSKTRKEIKKILGDETLAMSANWADFIKSEPSYKYLDVWHYINFEHGMSYNQVQSVLENDTLVNAYTKINFMMAELKKQSLPQDQKTMYLRLLIHIVGDIHQPLHTGYADDKGGNAVQVSWFGKPANLHSIWDSELIDFQKLSYTEYAHAINHTTAEQREQWTNGNLLNWCWESYQITETLYKDVKPDDKLGYRYNYDHIETLNAQLVKGGVRLAKVLNQIFSGS